MRNAPKPSPSPPRPVSVLFNEPKLLKLLIVLATDIIDVGFSALQRAEIAEIVPMTIDELAEQRVSVLFNEPKLLKFSFDSFDSAKYTFRFSALQRAEIAEIGRRTSTTRGGTACFSALQRAEIAEMWTISTHPEGFVSSFSALQRAEIAEITLVMPLVLIPVEFQCSSTSRNC